MEEPSIEDLLLAGIIEVAALDSSGEFLYTFTDKLKEIMPELYAAHLNYVHAELMFFWEKGLINIDDMESSNPIITLTEKAFDEEYISSLSIEKRQSLEEIKRILKVI